MRMRIFTGNLRGGVEVQDTVNTHLADLDKRGKEVVRMSEHINPKEDGHWNEIVITVWHK